MIFLDGVGIGKNDPENNPFIKYGFKTFTYFFEKIPTTDNPFLTKDGLYLFPSDATLSVPGLPQSGTGQASIFCGENIPKFVGKHYGPYPYTTTIPILKEKNILIEIRRKGLKSFFANAYPKVFFDYLKSGKRRLSVTSLSCLLGEIKLNNVTDVRKGKALTAELTNERWNSKLGYKLPVITPESAAKRLIRIAMQNDFTLYEFYLTDHLGHFRLTNEFQKLYSELDKFLFEILRLVKKNSDEVTLIICSDHGNLEDMSIKTHTLNPSLTITAGFKAKELSDSIKDITQIKSAIYENCL
jgi:2,3-bisphosphoglycerate-independent phosphoglycerate mutase